MNVVARRPFDLNIEEVLEHWHVPEALRQLIAYALDEHALTGTREPEIVEMTPGNWRIRDWGRGLRYEHFTQQLRSRERFLGTLLHEIGHAFTAAPDIDPSSRKALPSCWAPRQRLHWRPLANWMHRRDCAKQSAIGVAHRRTV
jgi:hypothetical protein